VCGGGGGGGGYLRHVEGLLSDDVTSYLSEQRFLYFPSSPVSFGIFPP
jgi:hypothetical protein